MKTFSASLILLMMGISSTSMADVDKTLCPQVLNRPALGLASDQGRLTAMFEAWNNTNGWMINQDLDNSFVFIAPAAVRNFRIKVVEEQGDPSKSVSVLEVDCPLPMTWEAVTQPRVNVAFPSKIADANTVNTFQEVHTVKGFSFSTLTGARQSLTIHPLWRLLEAEPQDTINLPPYIPADKVSVSSGRLASDQAAAVRAFRMGPQADLSQQKLWHLVLQSNVSDDTGCTYFAVDRSTSEFFKLPLTEATKVACEIEQLTYWNAETGRVVNCVNTVNFTDPNNCANVNMRSYSSILEKLRKNEAFYVQLFVKTGKSFALPTYKVDKTGIQLLKQTTASAPADLGLPREIAW